MKKALIGIVIFSSFLFVSCRKANDGPSWDTELLAPIANASLNLNNLLTNSVIQANPDSSLKLVYENNFYGLKMDTLFKIPDTTISQILAIPISGITFAPGTVIPVLSPNTNTTYQLPGVQLRTVIVKSGKVSYSIQSTVKHTTDFHYSIPSATLNGQPFSINITVPAAVGSSPGIYNQIFDLSGYTIDLTGYAHNMVNTITTSLNVNISNSGDSVLVNNDQITISNKFYDIIPYYAKGYFGQNTFNIGPALSNFDVFKNIVSGSLSLEDVNFNLKIENPIGLDARMYINNLSSLNSHTNHLVDLQNSIMNTPININRASESNGYGTGTIYPTYANFPLTTTNSNIRPFVENLPDKLSYSLQIITNPLGNVSGSNDFIFSDHLLKAQLNMEIPLSLMANNLTLVDTLALNISNKDNVQNVHSGTLTLFAENGFPFNAGLQMYLLNDQHAIADSIFGYANTIDQAPVNSSLRVTDKKLTKIIIPVSESKMKLLYDTKHIALKVKFNTSAQPNYVKIYSDYTIDVKLVGDINYTVHLK